MSDLLGEGRLIGYCTNVHAGTDLQKTKDNLVRYAGAVRNYRHQSAPLPIGLWLSAQSISELSDAPARNRFASWLSDNDLNVYTINGFPYFDFHEPVVKHRVYNPDWSCPERAAFTRDLAVLLATILPPGSEGSISTLPVAWGTAAQDPERISSAVDQLVAMSQFLAELSDRTNRLIHLDLEPEPGCVLSQSRDVAPFFDKLYKCGDDDLIYRHIRICHDICHAAVMFEEPQAPFAAYAAAGAQVGKVQVSSALTWCLEDLCPPDRLLARQQLKAYAEPRYLHQTSIRRGSDGHIDFYEDLSEAFQNTDEASCEDEWRIHFHIPIHLKKIGALGTTQSHIEAVTKLLKKQNLICPLEIETYAWNVLPGHHGDDELIQGIAAELEWFEDLINV